MPKAIAADSRAMPDFTLQTLDGTEISRESLAGKVVVVNFWATWCSDCMNAIPEYITLYRQFAAEEDFVFLAVSLDEERAEFVRTFVEKKGLPYPVALGTRALAQAFGGIEEIPTSFIIDRAGNIRHKQSGSLSHQKYTDLILPLLDTTDTP